MPEPSSYDGAPVVNEVWVNGRRIPITCRRNYDEAKLDYARSVAKSQGKRIIQVNSAMAQGMVITNVLDSANCVPLGVVSG